MTSQSFQKRGGPAGMYQAEADGLRWIAEADAVRTPQVYACDDNHIDMERFAGDPGPRYDELLGRGLAKLHRAGAEHFGYSRDNFIAVLPQSNRRHVTFAEFYRNERLRPLAKQVGLAREVDAMRVELPEEPPARLHGDLWSGNVLADERGEPVLIDPSVYGGHREIDLAMMRLFGGFSPRVFAAYEEYSPLQPNAGDRVALFQLYPLLVHAVLFGGGYTQRARDVCKRYT